jgi:hypothetical protein
MYALEPPTGGRDQANLLKGILIQEAVRSAWRSVEQGHQVEVNNWQSTNAMGLDVIGEDEEEEEEGRELGEVDDDEERSASLFEELLQNLTEYEAMEEHEWAESEVGSAIDQDDFEYDQDFEHYTLPSPPPSPTQLPSSPTTSSSLSLVASPPSASFTLESGPATDMVDNTPGFTVAIESVELDDGFPQVTEMSSGPVRRDSIPATPLLLASRSPPTSPILALSLRDDNLYSDQIALTPDRHHTRFGEAIEVSKVAIDSQPLALILSAACSPSSPIPTFSLIDDELDCDDLVLPPALHRCSSTSSIPCDCDDVEEDDDCQTPPSSYGDLENSISSLLSLDCDDDIGDQVIMKSGDYYHFGSRPSETPGGGFGLGLDMGIGIS